MTLDLRMVSSFARAASWPHDSPRGSAARPGSRRGPSFAPLALLIASACASCRHAAAPVESAGGGGVQGSVTLSPGGDVRIGPQDDFDPANLRRRYVLANGTAQPLSWEVQVSQPWLWVSDTPRAVLAPGESVSVRVDIDPSAANVESDAPAVGSVVFLESPTRAVLGTSTVILDTSFARSGSGGWTSFTPSLDTRTIFVSSSGGDDLADGLSPATPKRTIAAGVALLRHGFPDWLRLKRGDVWQESLGAWRKSGRGPQEPMLVTTYGDALERPLLRTGVLGGIWTNGGGGTPPTIDDLAIVGLHFTPDAYTGGGSCVGAEMLQPGSRLLIEDCEFEGYCVNLVFQGFGGRHGNIRLRRSVIVDAYAVHSIGGHSQGLYAYGVDGLVIEENVFDHNGWRESVPGAGADIYSHNLYIDNGNTGVVVRGNVIANGSSHGLQLRCGGSAVNNLFVRNSISLLVGGGNSPEPGGVHADVRGNVILDGKDIDAANPRGWGLVLSNLASGNVAYNIVAHNVLGTQPAALILDGDAVGDNGPSAGIHDTAIVGNIVYDWGGGVLVEGALAQLTQLEFSRNSLQNAVLPEPLIAHAVAGTTAAVHAGDNRFFNQLAPANAWTKIARVPHSIDYWKAQVGDTTSVSEQVVYADPERSLSSYNVLVGGALGFDAFLAQARQQSRAHWRAVYMATRANRYLRAGF